MRCRLACEMCGWHEPEAELDAIEQGNMGKDSGCSPRVCWRRRTGSGMDGDAGEEGGTRSHAWVAADENR
jgi:hypothetical protein